GHFIVSEDFHHRVSPGIELERIVKSPTSSSFFRWAVSWGYVDRGLCASGRKESGYLLSATTTNPPLCYYQKRYVVLEFQALYEFAGQITRLFRSIKTPSSTMLPQLPSALRIRLFFVLFALVPTLLNLNVVAVPIRDTPESRHLDGTLNVTLLFSSGSTMDSQLIAIIPVASYFDSRLQKQYRLKRMENLEALAKIVAEHSIPIIGDSIDFIDAVLVYMTRIPTHDKEHGNVVVKADLLSEWNALNPKLKKDLGLTGPAVLL
ncbi:hypothetical protein FB446DRAFT_834531, partial [Lentinula raphanica]